MVKNRKMKFKSIENEGILMAMTMAKTITAKKIITIKMRMWIKIVSYRNIETLKHNKKWSSKSNLSSCFRTCICTPHY